MSGVGGYPYSILGYPYLQMPMAAAALAQAGQHTGSAAGQHPGSGGMQAAYHQQMLQQQPNTQMLSQSYLAASTNLAAAAPYTAAAGCGLQQTATAVSVANGSVPSLQKYDMATGSINSQQAASRALEIPPKPDQIDIPEDKDEYIKELIEERENIENCTVSNLSKSHVLRLLNQEITRLQGGGIFYGDDVKFLDVYREKCTRITIRVLVPVREHPKFNFVGKLLGPKGNSLKRIQEDTLTKMAVLGRGSMRDKDKEEDLRASGDPKYGHLQEELHVEITAYAPPAEAYARLAFALTEIRKYLIPDSNDTIRQQQMRELEILSSGHGAAAGAAAAALGLAVGAASPGTCASLMSSQAPDSTSQLQLITSPSILVPSHGYHIPLLPTPPLDTSPSPTITALPTKYEELQESLQQQQQQISQQQQQQSPAVAVEAHTQPQQDSSLKEKSKSRGGRKFSPY